MDSLPLFTIPKWLPKQLLPELWSIIFWWKWRLEIIDIHKELYLKMKYYRTKQDGTLYLGEYKPHSDIWIRTNYLWSKRGRWYGTEWGIQVRVVPKCGYKHRNVVKRPRINGRELHNGPKWSTISNLPWIPHPFNSIVLDSN